MKNNNQRNVLFFQQSLSKRDGGVPRVTDIISKELSNRGYNCYFVFSIKGNDEYSDDMKLYVSNRVSSKACENLILNFIEDHHIDIFVCQNLYSSAYRKVYKKIRTTYPMRPFLCFLHASPNYWQNTHNLKIEMKQYEVVLKYGKNLLKRLIYPFYNPYVISTKDLYNICDRFVLLSKSFKRQFIAIYDIQNVENKLSVIPNPLTFSKSIPANELKNKEKLVLIVSRLKEDQKNILSALNIWYNLFKTTESDWTLLILGDGPDRKLYEEYIRSHKLKNVALLGDTKNVLDYYKRASILMMTSFWEGLPMTLLEAQQNGVVPIVFDNFSSINDIISDGETGYIVRNNNKEEFLDKLNSTINQNELRMEIAVNAIQSAKRFEVVQIVDRWEELFNLEKVY